ncbi:restriction endonuclease subunit S [Mitsuokella jalaludinii]|uniref:EcoKI restriction-modification system protein HsdS n=1 Tax=Mitsuokella jalaludinii TaxID=187979 RepID=A0A174BN12_9FIRM|nr:restriction endonuclease subunit S [Mitsuokella jalaludinii]CUO00956.1 EcoKI restriction-modification system protein HsdS [Mitsuokella jalaludinii]
MKKRLGDYIKEYSVRNKENQDIPVYSVTNTEGFCQDYFGKEVASKDKSTYKIVPQGYFAYNPSRINVGSVDWQRTQERVIVSPLYNVFSVSDKLDQQYLYYYLKSDFALQRIKAVATGSVRDNLKLKMLYEFPINIPELSSQKNIVELLDKIKKIEGLKKAELDYFDTLVKARFVEMFEKESDQWHHKKLVECCDNKNDIKCGPFGSQLHVEDYQNIGVPVYGIPEVNSGFKSNPKLYISQQKAEELSAYSLIDGDVAVSRKGNVGQAALFYDSLKNGIIHSDVLRVRLNKQIMDPFFLIGELHFSQSIRNQVKQASNGAIMPGINVTKLKQIVVDIPPLAIQKEFSGFIQQVEKSKVAIQKSLDETQILFQSLMQKYFG